MTGLRDIAIHHASQIWRARQLGFERKEFRLCLENRIQAIEKFSETIARVGHVLSRPATAFDPAPTSRAPEQGRCYLLLITFLGARLLPACRRRGDDPRQAATFATLEKWHNDHGHSRPSRSILSA